MLGEFLIGRQIKLQVEAYMCRHIKFTNTHRKWSFCNVCRCVRLKTNTHKTVKQGPAKENKFNTVFCKSVNQLSGQRNHSLNYIGFSATRYNNN